MSSDQIFSTDDFVWDDRQFVAFASNLEGYTEGQEYVKVVSANTGEVEVFRYMNPRYGHGLVLMWEYQGVLNKKLKMEVHNS